MGLSGCDSPQKNIDDIGREVRKAWDKIEHSKAVQKMTGEAMDALHALENATKTGAKDVKEKLEKMEAAVAALYAVYKSSLHPPDGPYVLNPKCLLAMAVGGGAVLAAEGLALAALGFAAQGVEAASLEALWKRLASDVGDSLEGSLLARLKKLGAKGLSVAQYFKVYESLAKAAAIFCGVVNNLCHGCIANAPHLLAVSTATIAAGGQTNHLLAVSNATAASAQTNEIVF
uniref:Uncharacterized protein n=1 Tax=Strombidinopsis acuminata TaxID=141414 RepID=A0A7S3RYX6_9SPIT|mmetsp:Transcript_16080/g.21961  ORF Transcript_16080/g.21961 Transcript_16080/m.21961 type:complete len:231 (+) Transcript_16080:1-693(+)